MMDIQCVMQNSKYIEELNEPTTLKSIENTTFFSKIDTRRHPWPILLTGFNFNPSLVMDKNIPSHTLPGMWLLKHAGIEFKPWQ